MTIRHQVRTAPYELDMSGPLIHRLDMPGPQMEMLLGRLNTSMGREHKQVAQTQMSTTTVAPEPLPQRYLWSHE